MADVNVNDEPRPTWTIWVCGCPNKVTEEDWALDALCGRCKQEYIQIEVAEVDTDERS